MAVQKSIALKQSDKTIDTIKNVIYNGLQAVEITLENGQRGYMATDRFNAEVANFPTHNGKEDGNLMLPADFRLSNRGYWTNLQRSVGVGSVTLAGE